MYDDTEGVLRSGFCGPGQREEFRGGEVGQPRGNGGNAQLACGQRARLVEDHLQKGNTYEQE